MLLTLLRIWTHSASGTVSLGDAQLAPGGKATAPIELGEPSAVRVGDIVEVTEGGRAVGSAVIVSVDD